MQTKIKAIFNSLRTQYSKTNLCAGIECVKDNINVLASKFAKAGISANTISYCGFVLGLMAINCLANNYFGWALLFILLNRLGDALDGAVAKIKGKTDFGVFLDASLDYIFYAGVILGFALSNPEQNALSATFLLFGFATSACVMLAFAVIAYSKGNSDKKMLNESPFYLGGLAQGAETLTAFVLMCLVPNWFVPVALILGCWCLIKALVLISSAYYKFVIMARGK
ncbi:MAG: CDP-alcohol phosphatidyltransferase family protein [Alphaproteobacteria bacterium]|nr:CDP-alcohol phosphatidyltransferase family protein [Alphaproteobacteria bacterium]